jgi:hypothetical protein
MLLRVLGARISPACIGISTLIPGLQQEGLWVLSLNHFGGLHGCRTPAMPAIYTVVDIFVISVDTSQKYEGNEAKLELKLHYASESYLIQG